MFPSMSQPTPDTISSGGGAGTAVSCFGTNSVEDKDCAPPLASVAGGTPCPLAETETAKQKKAASVRTPPTPHTNGLRILYLPTPVIPCAVRSSGTAGCGPLRRASGRGRCRDAGRAEPDYLIPP